MFCSLISLFIIYYLFIYFGIWSSYHGNIYFGIIGCYHEKTWKWCNLKICIPRLSVQILASILLVVESNSVWNVLVFCFCCLANRTKMTILCMMRVGSSLLTPRLRNITRLIACTDWVYCLVTLCMTVSSMAILLFPSHCHPVKNKCVIIAVDWLIDWLMVYLMFIYLFRFVFICLKHFFFFNFII